MLIRRCIAFAIDFLLISLGGVAGFAVGIVTVQSANTMAGMGNVVVFALLVVAGCTVALVAISWAVAIKGRSPGQRIANVRYGEPIRRWRCAVHHTLAWLLPVLLVALPTLALSGLHHYRSNLERAHMDHTQVRVESDKELPAYREKLAELEHQLKRADWFAPAWLVGNDGLPWLLVMYGPLLIYVVINARLLRRPPFTALPDRIAGVRIVSS